MKRYKWLIFTVFILYTVFQILLLSSQFSSKQTKRRKNVQEISEKVVFSRSSNKMTGHILVRNGTFTSAAKIAQGKYQHITGKSRQSSVGEFQLLDKSRREIVISAIVSRDNQLVIIGTVIRELRSVNSSRCQFFATKNESVGPIRETSKSTRLVLEEHHGRKYGAAYFTCAIPHGIKPYAVSLVAEKCEKPSNFIPIQYPEEQRWQFTVCVTPFNYRYSKAYELVEMVELNQLLGADQIVFYNYSTHYNVDRVLQYYIDQGVVQVVQWHLPMKVDTWPKIKGRPVEIHYFGQLAALNDCLYRNRYRSRYLVYQDLDEFIIPHKHENWKDMIKSMGEDRGVYMFRNVFFRKEWNDTTRTYTGKDIAKKYKAVTLLKLRREDKIHGPRHRSKYILNPKLVDVVGIHNIWKAKEGGLVHNVSPDIGLLHHYRNWENPTDPIRKIDDDTAMKYKDRLVARLKNTWEKLPGVPLGPL